jgi:hypothetical protein
MEKVCIVFLCGKKYTEYDWYGLASRAVIYQFVQTGVNQLLLASDRICVSFPGRTAPANCFQSTWSSGAFNGTLFE